MIYKRFADNTEENSVATSLRRKRFKILLDMIQDCPEPAQILDIGGTQQYWDMMVPVPNFSKQIDVTLLNSEPEVVTLPNFKSVIGDGRSMPQYVDNQFDIVFSNSTIEHVGDFDDQIAMASEVIRIGRMYYVQTPNLHFPIEPHFVFPFFQFLPLTLRVWLVQHFDLGWFSRMPDREVALREVSSIRLLKKNEFELLFPNARIYEEKFFGMTKSFIAYAPLNKDFIGKH